MTLASQATTWRDLADQLTPRQVEQLTQHEANYADGQQLLVEARACAEENFYDRLLFGDVTAPAGAVRIFTAQRRDDGTWFREFTGTARDVAGVTVHLDGVQSPDGSVRRQLAVVVNELGGTSGGELSADDARALAATLTEAADELERLS